MLSLGQGFARTYEGLKHAGVRGTLRWDDGSFARTYEGLKRARLPGCGTAEHGFARTYEGLKRAIASPRVWRSVCFARTYEGLKPTTHQALQRGRWVLPVPMRD